MTRHFDEDEICRWVAGERDAGCEAHLAGCAACRAEVEHAGQAVSQFGDFVRARSASLMKASDSEWSQRLQGLVAPEHTKPAKHGRIWVLGPVAASVAICLSLGWCSLNHVKPTSVAGAVAAESADAELLRRVDAEVSRTIPGPMEPLTKLVDTQSGGQ